MLPYVGQGHESPNEIHIRFYRDRIFAEFEIGRAYVSHFIGPRLNANEELLRMISGSISTAERELFSRMTEKERLKDDESSMALWDGRDYFSNMKKKQRVLFSLLAAVSVLDLLGWRLIAIIIFVIAGAAMVFLSGNMLLSALLSVVGVAGSRLLPKKGSVQ